MLVINPNNNQIEFQLTLENAEYSEATVRLVVEVNDTITVVPLDIADGGICKGELPLHENWDNTQGKVTVEVIAKNTHFIPFTREVLFEGLEVLKPALLEVSIDVEEDLPTRRVVDARKKSIKNLPTKSVNENKAVKKSTVKKATPALTSEIRDFFKIK